MSSELEPKFILIDNEADAYVATIETARKSLHIFKENLKKYLKVILPALNFIFRLA